MDTDQDSPPIPTASLLRTVNKYLQIREKGLISDEELASSLFDAFVHAHTCGHDAAVEVGIGHLSSTVAKSLLEYAEKHPEPRLFVPYPTEPVRLADAQKEAIAAQAAVVFTLRGKTDASIFLSE